MSMPQEPHRQRKEFPVLRTTCQNKTKSINTGIPTARAEEQTRHPDTWMVSNNFQFQPQKARRGQAPFTFVPVGGKYRHIHGRERNPNASELCPPLASCAIPVFHLHPKRNKNGQRGWFVSRGLKNAGEDRSERRKKKAAAEEPVGLGR